MAAGRILLIEDNPDDAAPCLRQLARAGYEVRNVDAVGLARGRIAADQTDLILLDLHLRDSDGMELLRWLRAEFGAAMPPVVVVTVSSEPETRLEALRLGATDVLRKPLDWDELRAKVAGLLEIKRLRDEVALRNRELEEAKERLEQTLRLKRQFLALITHDLRTPITTIKLSAEVLRGTMADRLPDTAEFRKVRDLLAVLLRNTQRVETNFNEIMTIARLDSAEPELNLGPVDLNELARDAIAECVEAAEPCLSSVEFAAEPLPPLVADARLVRQMLVNIVSTSLSRMDVNDRAVLAIRCEDDGVAVTLTDTGPFLDHGFLQQLMEGLEHNTPTPQTRVTLYAASRIAHAHGGRFRILSDPDRGTQFQIWLPLRPAPPRGPSAGPGTLFFSP